MTENVPSPVYVPEKEGEHNDLDHPRQRNPDEFASCIPGGFHRHLPRKKQGCGSLVLRLLGELGRRVKNCSGFFIEDRARMNPARELLRRLRDDGFGHGSTLFFLRHSRVCHEDWSDEK